MIDPALVRDREISVVLTQTWPAFFARFGRLTPVQREAIPPILSGTDVLISSATASGKTEAACAPLVERNLDRREPWTILYISPTRALVNDLYERLRRPINMVSLSLRRRTGEHHSTSERMPHVLLTTPESLDSMLCRLHLPEGHQLAQVVGVVLDEVHLLYGTSRGEQTRWLLERLRRLRSEAKTKGWTLDDSLQVVALSATVSRPEEVAATYLRNGTLVHVPGGRTIEVVTPCGGMSSVEQSLPDYIANLQQPEKILVFANSRRRVDELTVAMRQALKDLGYVVMAHHGSLDRRLREAAEEAVRTEAKIVLFATSTLEIGVDIGDIDLVVLDEPAPDMAGLLQRIGRGNRCSDMTRVMPCIASPEQVVIHNAMLDAARAGWLGSHVPGPQHAVARQQVFSYILQSRERRRGRKHLTDFVEACAGSLVSSTLIDHLVQIGDLIEDGKGLRLSDEWIEKAATGKIHSNIEDVPGQDVHDAETGERLATGVHFRGGSGMRVSGQHLRVRERSDRKITVEKVDNAQLSAGEWGYVSRSWQHASDQYAAVRRLLDIPSSQWPVIRSRTGTRVFHFGGMRRRAVLQLMLTLAGVPEQEASVNGWCLHLQSGPLGRPRWMDNVSLRELNDLVVERTGWLERQLGRPQANRWLPMALRTDEVRGWLCLEDELAEIQTAVWTLAEQDVAEVLLRFVEGR